MALFGRLKQLIPQDKAREKGSSGPDPPEKAPEVSDAEAKLPTDQESREALTACLTPRERDLFYLLLEGHTLKESAARLSIKYSTANTHMTGIYRKLGVNSRAELIINYRFALDTGRN